MIEETIARGEARHIYDWLGVGLDRAARFEGRAKALALELPAVAVGQRVLHLGVGTGADHAALQRAAGQLGGCRPLQLAGLLEAAGFTVERHIVVQRGFPSGEPGERVRPPSTSSGGDNANAV